MFAFSLDMTSKLLSDFVTHSSSCCSSCCLQLVPFLRRPAPKISFLERESVCILSSSPLLCFRLVPIVLRELVVTVVYLPKNFDSFSGVADASTIIVERLPGFVFVIHISGIFAESRLLVNSLALRIRSSVSICSRVGSESVSNCGSIAILSSRNKCTSVCTKITPVLLLALYLVRIHAACLIVSLLLLL